MLENMTIYIIKFMNARTETLNIKLHNKLQNKD